MTGNEDVIFHVLAALKKKTVKCSNKKWNKVCVLNDKILEDWTLVLVFGFFEISSFFYVYNSMNDNSNQQHRLRQVFEFWLYSLFGRMTKI